MPTRASAMELNIPGVRGVDDSLIYFVDRYRDFSIYDVDFVPLPGSDRAPPAIAGLHYFGVVQTIRDERSRDWVEFYRQLFGFSVLPGGQYFGILPKGTLLESPCHKFYLQLLEPPPGAEDIEWDERLLRIGLGAPDVLAATRALRDRGVVFVDRDPVQPTEKGALTQVYLGGVTFELVVSHLKP
jgi:4-hydroxyphenylpyruvate dioxygenase